LETIEAKAKSNDKLTIAKTIYNWILDNMEYKKTGTGWGNGDTFWACSELYGNCTDFHSMFISLARTLGIPARFEMGFPVPTGKEEGIIGGYHCWLQFFIENKGWIPVDASEAAKHPEKKEQLFGSQPLDRILFTIGRDIKLGSDHKDKPLNYFIYPYVEIDGESFDQKLNTEFSYKDL